MNSTIFLFSACWFFLIFFKLSFSLHMLQIEGYKNKKYINWARQNTDKIHTKNDAIYTAFCIINTVLFLFAVSVGKSNLDRYAMSNSLFTSFLLLMSYKNKYKPKKSLVFTPRAKRLLFIALVLAAADFFIVAFVTTLISGNFVKYFPLWSGLLAIVYYFSSYYIAGANYIAKPIEHNINQNYYNKALHKIKGMEKNLISVGITGSYGKTSTKFATAAILKEKYNVLNTPESYNTPMGISKIINNDLTSAYNIFIAELGATKIGDIREVAVLTNPKIGILTSIGPCHLDTFVSIENIMKTKYELIEALPDDGTAVFNYDNEYIKVLADKTEKKKILYAIKNAKEADVFAADITAGNAGSKFTLHIKNIGNIQCETKLLGEHNILNILAGAAAASILGLSLQEIKNGIGKIESVAHRLQLIDPGNGVLVIDDAFNSNPDGVKAALDVLKSFNDRRKIIVTPGMVELGEIQERENELFGELIADVCHIAVLVGKNQTKPIQKGLKNNNFHEENIYVVNSLDEASKVLGTLTKVNDVVLFENDLPDTYNEN